MSCSRTQRSDAPWPFSLESNTLPLSHCAPVCCVVILEQDIHPSLVLVQPRKTRPCSTIRLLMGRKESNQTVNKQTDKIVYAGCLLVTLLTARENVKSISFDIWQHKYLLAFKPCENCNSLHDNMANTNSIVVAAIDSEYFAIIFAKRDRCCRGRHLSFFLSYVCSACL